MDAYAGPWLDSELAREKLWARIHLIPMLQAEADRDNVRRELADQAREKELLGAVTRPYNSPRYALTYSRRPCAGRNLTFCFVMYTAADVAAI